MRTSAKLFIVIVLASSLSGCWYLESQVKLEKKRAFYDYTQEQFAQLPPEEQRHLWREFDEELRKLERRFGS